MFERNREGMVREREREVQVPAALAADVIGEMVWTGCEGREDCKQDVLLDWLSCCVAREWPQWLGAVVLLLLAKGSLVVWLVWQCSAIEGEVHVANSSVGYEVIVCANSPNFVCVSAV